MSYCHSSGHCGFTKLNCCTVRMGLVLPWWTCHLLFCLRPQAMGHIPLGQTKGLCLEVPSPLDQQGQGTSSSASSRNLRCICCKLWHGVDLIMESPSDQTLGVCCLQVSLGLVLCLCSHSQPCCFSALHSLTTRALETSGHHSWGPLDLFLCFDGTLAGGCFGSRIIDRALGAAQEDLSSEWYCLSLLAWDVWLSMPQI